MKRIGVATVLLIVAALLFGTFGQDSLYWKRRALAAIHSPATLPASYYEPSELIEGSADGGSIPRVSPEQERLDPAALQAAVDYAGDYGTTALIVGRHGHIAFEHYWDDATFDTVIDAGAFSATLTALAVGMAMSDQKIALPAEPVANYIESFRDPARAAITLEDLLHMTSGLGSRQGGADPWTASTREQFVRDIRNECLELPSSAPRGSVWHPQACDPQLLAHIIERATGQQYSKYVSDRLWKPIGAGDAHLMLDREGGTAHASCCLRARQGDWMRVAELLVTDGKFGGEQILPPGWVRAMLTPSKANNRFGYQVWRGAPLTGPPSMHDKGTSEPYAAADTFLLKGNGKTRLWLVPSMGLSILRVGTDDRVDSDWDDSRIPNIIIRGASDYVPRAGAQGVSDLVPNH
jgi:CubicO group peptidase (beta-lactamase class C family)